MPQPRRRGPSSRPPPSVPPAGRRLPTLEDLFGSLDYCSCSDCGSILSPAAYLVDLLNYIDQPAPATGFSNPQDVLLGRRPDLQYLPLTCANTNTALPYIDIVNETLEYFVANGLTLDGYQGHDTGDTITSAELLASPQYVNDAAYAILQDAFFPPPLPFNRPLALLRLHLQSLGLALPDAMAALRAGDSWSTRRRPTSYGWSDILIEQLAISRDEYRLFTDPTLQLGDLYGLPDASALADLQAMSLQDFSRRLGVSYDDLTAIVATQFINPNAGLIPRLQQLDAPFATLQALHDTLNTPQSIAASFISALPAGLDATQYGGTSPADYQAVVDWVTGPAVYPLIMDIITISEPGGSTGDCSGASFQLRYSNPDNTANLLSGTDYLKLIRFIRLWRKLGPLLGDVSDAASIQHTDDVIAALYPAADVPADTSDAAQDAANRPLLDAGFQALLMRLGFLFRVMNQLSLTGDTPTGLAAARLLGPDRHRRPRLPVPGHVPHPHVAAAGSRRADRDRRRHGQRGRRTAHRHQPAQRPARPGGVHRGGRGYRGRGRRGHRRRRQRHDHPGPRVRPAAQRQVPRHQRGRRHHDPGRASRWPARSRPGPPRPPRRPPPRRSRRPSTVAGAATAGDTLTTTIDGVPITYTVAAADTPDTIAAGLAALINDATVPDPFSGLPLSSLIAASSAGAVVTILTVNAGAPFTLACSLTPGHAGTYAAAAPPTAGPVAAETAVTTINSVRSLHGLSTDTTRHARVQHRRRDQRRRRRTRHQLPLQLVQATSAGASSRSPARPGHPFTLTCSVTAGARLHAPALPEMRATVSGTIPAGAC